MRSPHDLHSVLDVAPLSCFFRLALALASNRFLGRLGYRLQAMFLEHLPRNRMNLRLGYHVALPDVSPLGSRNDRFPSVVGRLTPFKRSNRSSRSPDQLNRGLSRCPLEHLPNGQRQTRGRLTPNWPPSCALPPRQTDDKLRRVPGIPLTGHPAPAARTSSPATGRRRPRSQ